MAALPPMKAPAGIYVTPGPGRPEPGNLLGRTGAIRFGAFGDLAFFLAHIRPEGGDTFWIESTTGVISYEQVKADFDAGRITRVN